MPLELSVLTGLESLLVARDTRSAPLSMYHVVDENAEQLRAAIAQLTGLTSL